MAGQVQRDDAAVAEDVHAAVAAVTFAPSLRHGPNGRPCLGLLKIALADDQPRAGKFRRLASVADAVADADDVDVRGFIPNSSIV